MPYKDKAKQRECARIWARNHKSQIKVSQQKYKRKIKERTRSIKERTPCADCGEHYPFYVMDFDHVHGEKVLNVSRMVASHWSWKRIEAEVAKCEVVCANCHRERSQKQRTR